MLKGAEMSTVALASASGTNNDNGTNNGVLSLSDSRNIPQLMTPIDTPHNLPVVYVQYVGQHQGVPLRPLTEAERDAMAGFRPASLTDDLINRLRNDFIRLDQDIR